MELGDMDTSNTLKGLALTTLAAIAGRMMRRAKQRPVRIGWDLLWEIPLCVGCGFVGHSIAAWLHVSMDVEVGIIAMAAYLGPDGLEAVLCKFGKDRA